MTAALTIRSIDVNDIPHILAYWKNASQSDLDRMGEASRPDELANREFLLWFCRENPTIEAAGEDIIIWEFDDRSIGYCTLKEVQVAQQAQIHLHMWESSLRGRGLGAMFFCLSALHFREKFKLKELYCQPKPDNPMPNRMLVRIGFKPVCRIKQLSRDGTEIEQNRYLIDETTVSSYLRSASPYPLPG